jgi:hypothetical protein
MQGRGVGQSSGQENTRAGYKLEQGIEAEILLVIVREVFSY